ncbi:hypothetical protein FRC08_005533, partial [Ceratobasidium sp. 394]
MAVTRPYEKKLTSNTELEELVFSLLAFRFLEGIHTGTNLGTILFGTLPEYKILHKIGSITLNNASHNDTVMEEVQQQQRMGLKSTRLTGMVTGF